MSRPLPSLLPDPNKWIDTSSTKKKSSQRPLLPFRSTFSTPPATIRRKPPPTSTAGTAGAAAGPGPSTTAKWKVLNDYIDSPSSSVRQTKLTTKLNGMYTPPLTSSVTSRNRMKSRDTPGGSPTKARRTSGFVGDLKTDNKSESRLKHRVDDYWKSDEDLPVPTSTLVRAEPLKSDDNRRSRLLRPTRSAPSGSSSSSDHLDMDMDDTKGYDTDLPTIPIIPSSQLKRPRANTLNSPRLSSPNPTYPLCDLQTPNKQPTTSAPSSTPIQITPVPEDVLALHRRLCGRDTQRMKRIRSPRRPHNAEEDEKDRLRREEEKAEKAAKRKRVDGKELVEKRVKERAVAEKVGMKLVSSSQASREGCSSPSAHHGIPLSPLRTNLTSPKTKRSLPQSPLNRTESPKRQARVRRQITTIHSRGKQSLNLASPSPIRTPTALQSRALSPKVVSPQYVPSSSPVRPITPTMSQSHQSRHSYISPTPPCTNMNDHQETLFIFPQPQTSPTPMLPDFVPVPMEAETLLTWSLGAKPVPAKETSEQSLATSQPFGRSSTSENPSAESVGYYGGETLMIESEIRRGFGAESGWNQEAIEALRENEENEVKSPIPGNPKSWSGSIISVEKPCNRSHSSSELNGNAFTSPSKRSPTPQSRSLKMSPISLGVKSQRKSPRKNKRKVTIDLNANIGESMAPSSPSQYFPTIFSSSPPRLVRPRNTGRPGTNRPEDVIDGVDTPRQREVVDREPMLGGDDQRITPRDDQPARTMDTSNERVSTPSPVQQEMSDAQSIQELLDSQPSTPPTPLIAQDNPNHPSHEQQKLSSPSILKESRAGQSDQKAIPPKKPLVRRNGSGWKGLQKGVLSLFSQSLPQSQSPTASASSPLITPSSNKRRKLSPKRDTQGTPTTSIKSTPRPTPSTQKRKAKKTNNTATQPKLASFGFFADSSSSTKKLKKEEEAFEVSWEDEPDLDVDAVEDGEEEITGERVDGFEAMERGTGREDGKILKTVPLAPYHPHLFPAGIRELKRRAQLSSATPSASSSQITPPSQTKLPGLSLGKIEIPVSLPPSPNVGAENEVSLVLQDSEVDLDEPPLFEDPSPPHDRAGETTDSGSGSSFMTTDSEGLHLGSDVKNWWDGI